MNLVTLIGRLTKDPEVRYTASTQSAVAKFTLAVDRGGKDKGADFINCTCFGKTAELVEKYVGKGKQIAVNGRIQTGSYEKDGRKVYTTDVIVEKIEFLGGKEASGPAVTPSASFDDPTTAGFSELDDIPF